MQPNFMFSWPHGRMGVASSEQLGTELDSADLDYEYTSSNLIHDGCILPSETRKVSVKKTQQDYNICTLSAGYWTIPRHHKQSQY